MDYEIAIPSYRRADTLKNKTIQTLIKYGVDLSKITVFVGSEDEYEVYRRVLDGIGIRDIIIGEVGMGAIRKYIQLYYPEGTYIMNFDDDLSDILKKKNDKTLIPIDNLEEDLIVRGFKELEKNDAYLFGIYAVDNPMFMNNRVSVGLYYCIGSCWGIINRHSREVRVTLDDKEDFERTLQHYVKDGKVVRLDDITVKSKYYTEDGGMQVERTSGRVLKSAEYLVDKYPKFCDMYIRKTTGHAELRLRDKGNKFGNLGDFL